MRDSERSGDGRRELMDLIPSESLPGAIGTLASLGHRER
jgi:hypothetical protein